MQLSLALNLLIVGIGVPVSVSMMMNQKAADREATRVDSSTQQLQLDEDHAVLDILNERRRERGLPELAALPSHMDERQLRLASTVTSRAAALTHGVHLHALSPAVADLMARCESLAAQNARLDSAIHGRLTHRTAGSGPQDHEQVLAEARRQGVEI